MMGQDGPQSPGEAAFTAEAGEDVPSFLERGSPAGR
jgi:hypothetical protein